MYKVGDEIIIARAEGYVLGSTRVPLKDPFPEHIGKVGTITKVEDGVCLLLADGTELKGSECWWRKLARSD